MLFKFCSDLACMAWPRVSNLQGSDRLQLVYGALLASRSWISLPRFSTFFTGDAQLFPQSELGTQYLDSLRSTSDTSPRDFVFLLPNGKGISYRRYWLAVRFFQQFSQKNSCVHRLYLGCWGHWCPQADWCLVAHSCSKPVGPFRICSKYDMSIRKLRKKPNLAELTTHLF